jgi:MtrB/PioB family decaheme-associated outer membrane protein
MEMDKANYFLNVGANEVARTDASYWANLTKAGTFKAGFLWDQIPDLVSTTTKSLFTEVSPGVLRVDPSVQTALQNAASTTPSTLAATLPAYLNNFAHEYDLGTNRHITSGSLQYLLSPDTTVNMDVSHTNRTGTVLYSGTFGFSNQVDVPEPISQHTTNTNMTFEHAAGDLLLRAGFTGTYFRNDLTTLTWDNPYRITDSATAPMQGRTALPPSNNWNVFNTSISWKLPKHTRLTGYVAFGFLDDNGAAIIPQTINTAIAVIPLARSTVQGQAQTQNMSLTFTSRPTKTMDVDVRYRYNNIDDLTPVYMNMSRVPYDSSVETGTAAAPLATASTDRYGIGRQTLDANVHVSMPGGSSMGVGYTGNRATYEDRIFASSVTNEEHISFDTLSMQYFSLHTNYAHSVRRGSGLDTSEIAYDGEQTSLRTYDIADVNSDLFTIAASLFPTSSLSVTFTAGDGQDQYPNTNLGVSNAKHYVYGVDLDLEPTNHVSVTAGYNLDDYNAIEWSRNAATTTAATFADPSKDWSDTNHDRVATVSGGLSFLHLNDKIDIRFGYNYNRSRGMYLYGLGSAPLDPTAATTLAAPVQLPTLVNDLTRGTFDVSYAFTPKVSFSFTYWYERYQVSDFALGASAIPNLNILTTDVLMGYQYLPYTANSFFGRLVCRF